MTVATNGSRPRANRSSSPALRDDARERPPRSRRALGGRRGRCSRSAVAVVAARVRRSPTTRSVRAAWSRACSSVAWGAAAVFVARAPPARAARRLDGRRRVRSARSRCSPPACSPRERRVRRPARPRRRPCAPSPSRLLAAVGLHLALGLPDGTLAHRRRARVDDRLGYVGVGRRSRPCSSIAEPAVSLTPIVIVSTAGARRRGGRLRRRCRRAPQPRTSAPGSSGSRGASVVAAAISLVACRAQRARRRGRSRSPASRSASTVLVPLALALGSSEQLAVRIDRLLVHSDHARRARRRWSAASTCSSCSASVASPTGERADAARPVDARGRASPRCCGCPCASGSPRSRPGASTATATRPTRCCGRSAAGSRVRSRSTSCSSSSRSR